MFRIFGIFLFAWVTFFFSWDLHAQTVLGPQRYFVGSFSGVKNHQETFSRTPEQAALMYRLSIKNGDGLPHTLKNCSGLNLLARLLCEAQNAVDKIYIALFRVTSAEIKLNNVSLVTGSVFNASTATAELQVALHEANNLHIKIRGGLLASIEITVQAINGNQPDQTPPTVLADLESGILTNARSVHISIADESEVQTDIFKDGELIATENVKEFDIPFYEGPNNFVLRARDEHGNQAPDFYFTATVDTYPPDVVLDPPPPYVVSSLPAQVKLRFLTGEVLQSFVADGVSYPHLPGSDQVYQAEKTVESEDIQTVNVLATDYAGNTSEAQFSFAVVIDNSPPQIELGEFPLYTNTDGVGISVVVTDDNDVTTEIQVNGEYFATVHTNNFTYWFELLTDGPTHISFIAIDTAGNTHSRHVTVVRDTSPLALSVQSPAQDGVYTSLSVGVQFSANRQLTAAYVNGISVPLAPDGQSVQYLYTSQFDGPFTVNIRAVDIFGQEAEENISGTIQLGGNALWTYSECPAE